MIGVIAEPSEYKLICEFFELFKTPWELYQNGRHYDVLVCCGDINCSKHTESLIVIYAGRELPIDAESEIRVIPNERRSCSYRGTQVPIYGDSVTFHRNGSDVVLDQDTREPALRLKRSNQQVLARVGYDLFREIRFLLTMGQPPLNADVPTVELHIAILRDLIVASGVKLIEIPPVPYGYRFIACLTHDVDHPSIRKHKLDHTIFGFLYRAIIGSVIGMFRGHASFGNLVSNWTAALTLPFIHLGLAKDIWCRWDLYLALEKGFPSTFFVIPFRDRSGVRAGQPAPRWRASRYGVADIAVEVMRLMTSGREIGLHAIDAWHDSVKGHAELQEIQRVTGIKNIGARIHWLYYDEEAPVVLENVGVDYDSTVGYNETIGYRTGTSQVYRPLNASELLELPMHIMDTALFFPNHLDLSPAEAKKQVSSIIDNAVQFGGVVTVNWHDRSIAPERCWDKFYVSVIDELRSKGAWFATGAEAVAWFRKRRAMNLDNVGVGTDLSAHINVTEETDSNLPALQILLH